MADSGYLPFFLSGMTIQNFTATGFRNLTDSTVEFGPGVNIFYGRNGSGKTNLLEAIMLVLLARSQRGAANGALLASEADFYRLTANVTVERLEHEVAVACERSGRKRIAIDGSAVRSSELYEHFSAVAVGPEDTQIAAGAPSERRRFLDLYLAQYKQGYLADLSDYYRCLGQRNAALKNNYDPSAFDEVMIPVAARIMLTRHSFITELAARAARHYSAIADTESLHLTYQPSVALREEITLKSIEAAVADRLLENRERERIMGVSLSGPQRVYETRGLRTSQGKTIPLAAIAP
jgi:DNA replication and repair protein RecF